MRHGPDVPNALTYAQRRRRHLCTTATCKKKAKRRRTKCEEHLAALREYHNARNRSLGKRTKAEYLANVDERVANAKRRSRFTDKELAAVPQCQCGIHHRPPCDLVERRREIATAGMGSWL